MNITLIISKYLVQSFSFRPESLSCSIHPNVEGLDPVNIDELCWPLHPPPPLYLSPPTLVEFQVLAEGGAWHVRCGAENCQAVTEGEQRDNWDVVTNSQHINLFWQLFKPWEEKNYITKFWSLSLYPDYKVSSKLVNCLWPLGSVVWLNTYCTQSYNYQDDASVETWDYPQVNFLVTCPDVETGDCLSSLGQRQIKHKDDQQRPADVSKIKVKYSMTHLFYELHLDRCTNTCQVYFCHL